MEMYVKKSAVAACSMALVLGLGAGTAYATDNAFIQEHAKQNSKGAGRLMPQMQPKTPVYAASSVAAPANKADAVRPPDVADQGRAFKKGAECYRLSKSLVSNGFSKSLISCPEPLNELTVEQLYARGWRVVGADDKRITVEEQ